MKAECLAITIAALLTIPASIPAADSQKGATFGRKVENTFRNWKVEELPPVVRKTVEQQSVGHRIKDIDREDRSGRTIWEVRLDGGPSGPSRKMHIDNDGRVLDAKLRPVDAGASARAESGSGASSPLPPDPGDKKGPSEKTKRKCEDVPPAVKKAVAKYGTPEHIRDIDVEKRDGLTVWELEFSREGQNIELHFTEDGRVLEHIDSARQPPEGK